MTAVEINVRGSHTVTLPPERATVHEVFTRVWRTFTAVAPTASIWLRASQTETGPAFMFYVDSVEVRQLNSGRLSPSRSSVERIV